MKALYYIGLGLMLFAWIDFGLSYAGVDVWREIIGITLPSSLLRFSSLLEGLLAVLLIRIGSSDSQNNSGTKKSIRGSDLRYNLSLTLQDVFNGSNKNITFNSIGTGIRTLSVNIPRGVEDGTRIRLSGEGEPGINGGSAGDLYIFISIEKDSLFTRAESDLFVKKLIPLKLAKEGGELLVDSIDGTKLEVKIPAGSYQGKQLRVRGKGMPILRSNKFGDLFIQIDTLEFDKGDIGEKHNEKNDPKNENSANYYSKFDSRFEKGNEQSASKVMDVEKFDLNSIKDRDDAQLEIDVEDEYLIKLRTIIFNKKSRQLTMQFYSNKYPNLSKEDLVKKIFNDYERDRS